MERSEVQRDEDRTDYQTDHQRNDGPGEMTPVPPTGWSLRDVAAMVALGWCLLARCGGRVGYAAQIILNL